MVGGASPRSRRVYPGMPSSTQSNPPQLTQDTLHQNNPPPPPLHPTSPVNNNFPTSQNALQGNQGSSYNPAIPPWSNPVSRNSNTNPPLTSHSPNFQQPLGVPQFGGPSASSNGQLTSPGGPPKSRIDPNQIPSPIIVQESDRAIFENQAFITSSKTNPPLASTDVRIIDEGK